MKHTHIILILVIITLIFVDVYVLFLPSLNELEKDIIDFMLGLNLGVCIGIILYGLLRLLFRNKFVLTRNHDE